MDGALSEILPWAVRCLWDGNGLKGIFLGRFNTSSFLAFKRW